MSKHFKTRIFSRLNSLVSYYVPYSNVSATHARGVRYCVFAGVINDYSGKINTFKEGQKYKKHIIVRAWHRNRAVHQIYTYHFPKTWSAACVANRELIKEAQRQAHALEHDHSYAAVEWQIRFFKHYFRVFRCGAQPEPGLKRYSRFYQYTYVCLYRRLKAEQAAQQAAQQSAKPLPPTAEDVTFDPVNWRPLRSWRSNTLQHIFTVKRSTPPPSPTLLWQEFCEIVT